MWVQEAVEAQVGWMLDHRHKAEQMRAAGFALSFLQSTSDRFPIECRHPNVNRRHSHRDFSGHRLIPIDGFRLRRIAT